MLLVVSVLMLALSACSPGSTADKPASTGSPTTSAGGGGGDSADDAALSAERDAYDLKLAACIRQQGVDVKDPQPGRGIVESGPAVHAASSKCITQIGPPPIRALSDQDMATIDQSYLKTAKCLRDLGYDVADPAKGTALAIEGVPEDDVATCERHR